MEVLVVTAEEENGGTAQVVEPPLMQLFPDVDPKGHADPYLAIRWCLSPELNKRIESAGFKVPYLLLTIRHTTESDWLGETYTHFYEDAHVIAPLDAEMTYVSFNRPGNHEVLATVVDAKTSKVKGVLRQWHRDPTNGIRFLDDGSPNKDVFGGGNANWVPVPFIPTNTKLNVRVDSGHFAKEPPAWANWLVNHFFQKRSRDQCHWRKRFIFSLACAPFALTVVWTLRLGAMGALMLFGVREPNWRFLLPFNFHGADPFKVYDPTFLWWQDKRGNFRKWAWPSVIVNPPSIVLGTIGLWLGLWMVHRSISWASAVGLIIAGLLALAGELVAIAIVVAGLYSLKDFVFHRNPDAEDSRRRAREKSQAAERNARLARLEAMACNSDNLAPRLDALPREKRTAYLRYMELKGRVCRPFAKG